VEQRTVGSQKCIGELRFVPLNGWPAKPQNIFKNLKISDLSSMFAATCLLLPLWVVG
jgi:hypothetical protein